MKYRQLNTTTGTFVLIQDESGAIRTGWLTAEIRHELSHAEEDARLLPALSKQLENYFRGHTVRFEKIAVPAGGPFHRACWEACRSIPRGQTRTYAQLAAMAGRPGAARAAGQAMRRNPMPVITPCHRVIGASGSLHGFGGSLARGGRQLKIKAALLRLEGAPIDPA